MENIKSPTVQILDMEFDPLSFFEPVETIPEPQTLDYDNINVSEQGEEHVQPCEGEKQEEKEEEGEPNDIPLQILDLPYIGPTTTANHLTTILKLFKPDLLKNYATSANSIETTTITLATNPKELSKYLATKDITINDLQLLSEHLNHSIDSVLSLTQLPTVSSEQTTAYLTKIISYPFPQLNEQERDQLYDLASYIMTANSAPALKGNTTRHVELDGLSSDIKLYEPALTEDKVGNITWGASLELSKLLLTPAKSITSKWLAKSKTDTILELGAGTGLVTIVLAQEGYRVVSTDLPDIIDNLTKNIRLNNLGCTSSDPEEEFDAGLIETVHTTSLDWRNPAKFLTRSRSPSGYKILIFSDPVYSHQHPYWVQRTVSEVLSKEKYAKVVFMVGRRERFQDVRDDLWRLMQELDLTELFRDLIDGRDDYGTLLYDYKVFGRL